MAYQKTNTLTYLYEGTSGTKQLTFSGVKSTFDETSQAKIKAAGEFLNGQFSEDGSMEFTGAYYTPQSTLVVQAD